jgi:hypothetical protein
MGTCEKLETVLGGRESARCAHRHGEGHQGGRVFLHPNGVQQVAVPVGTTESTVLGDGWTVPRRWITLIRRD